MSELVPCRITSGEQEPDIEFLPDLTEVEEQLILSDIDPAWHNKFRSASEAWDVLWEFNAPEMEQAADELYRERQAAEFRKQITDELLDDVLPALVRHG